MSATPERGLLTAPYTMEYTFTRSAGPVVGRFMAGLRDGKIEGVRLADGRVLVPPLEYDPQTGEDAGDFVEVGQEGVVTTWTWVAEPRPEHPLDRPFAWALIKLDGADTAMLHAVDAGNRAAMRTGMRVNLQWAEERKGFITDIRCFTPVEGV